MYGTTVVNVDLSERVALFDNCKVCNFKRNVNHNFFGLNITIFVVFIIAGFRIDYRNHFGFLSILFNALIYAEYRKSGNFFVLTGNSVVCIVLTVKGVRVGELRAEVREIDQGTGTIGREHITGVINVTRTTVRKHHYVGELIHRGVETDVTSVYTNGDLFPFNAVFKCELEERRNVVVRNIFGFSMVSIKSIVIVVGIVLDKLFESQKLLSRNCRFTSIYRERINDRIILQHFIAGLLGKRYVIFILEKIERHKNVVVSLLSRVFFNLVSKSFELFSSDKSGNQVDNFFTTDGVFYTNTATDVIDSNLLVSSSVLERAHCRVFIVSRELNDDLRQKLLLFGSVSTSALTDCFCTACIVGVGAIESTVLGDAGHTAASLIIVRFKNLFFGLSIILKSKEDHFTGKRICIECIAVNNSVKLHRFDFAGTEDTLFYRGESGVGISGLLNFLPIIFP